MSRGHGSKQRELLARLAEHAVNHPPLADFATEQPTVNSYLRLTELAGTRSERESFRRAGIKLHDEGLVDAAYVHKRGHRYSGQRILAFRLPARSPEYEAAAEKAERNRYQALSALMQTVQSMS